MPLSSRLEVATSIPSALRPDPSGKLRVRLIQTNAGREVLGSRPALEKGQQPHTRPPEVTIAFGDRLGKTEAGAINLLPYHDGIIESEKAIRKLSEDRTIVALAGVDPTTSHNYTYIAFDEIFLKQSKLSLSTDDAGIPVGSILNIFPADGDTVSWAVLNCHDYTHVDILTRLLKARVELLVVVTYNNAIRLYWEYALADIHRLFCYIAIVNIAEFGGSAIYGPFRRIGAANNARLGVGGQLLAISGQAEFDATVSIDIGELRTLRNGFRNEGIVFSKRRESQGFTSVVPSEHFVRTLEREANAPPVRHLETNAIQWQSDDPLIAIGQLNSMSGKAYLDTKYRIREHETCSRFERNLEEHLASLKRRLSIEQETNTPKLDFLVLPEVFVPRTFVDRLKDFSSETGATVICGVDYPGTTEADNANECLILSGRSSEFCYRKVTRSQYDAIAQDGKGLMPMSRGDKLMRFENNLGKTFGVLICYDFSHLDLMMKLNLEDRQEPLDVLFVIAHNPFGLLYRSCCIADAHRFYQVVVMCNVAEYGGSGVFLPRRESGARGTLMELGKGAEAVVTARLPLNCLRTARAKTDEQLQEGTYMRRPGVFQRRLLTAGS